VQDIRAKSIGFRRWCNPQFGFQHAAACLILFQRHGPVALRNVERHEIAVNRLLQGINGEKPASRDDRLVRGAG